MAPAVTVTSCVTLVSRMLQISGKHRRDGSIRGKIGNHDYNRREAAVILERDYFSRNVNQIPAFAEEEIEKSYGVPQILYERIKEGVCDIDSFFEKRI